MSIPNLNTWTNTYIGVIKEKYRPSYEFESVVVDNDGNSYPLVVVPTGELFLRGMNVTKSDFFIRGSIVYF